LGLSGLLVVSWGQPEAFLAKTFVRVSRDDAFAHLNGISTFVWSVHSVLILLESAASQYRRKDVLTVLMIGPVIAASIALACQRWTDPNWFDVVAICSISSRVGSLVGLIYWALKPRVE